MKVKVTYFEDQHGSYAFRVSKAKEEDSTDTVEMTEGELAHYQKVQATYDSMQSDLKRKLTEAETKIASATV